MADQSLNASQSSQQRNLPHTHHKLQNVVIDIESDDLTYNQARAIRQQIQKDVEQLQNRVRMLEQEEKRALKKIADTKNKTKQIRDLQAKNDEAFKQKLIEHEKSKIQEEQQRRSQLESRMKSQKDTNQQAHKIKEQKLQSVSEVRHLKDKARVQISDMRRRQEMELKQKHSQAEQEKRMAQVKQNEFIRNKVANARSGVTDQQQIMQSEIADFEKEAAELERMEAELLRKLQETQQNERAAFNRLENAMVDASIPKKMRRAGNATGESQMSGS